MSHDSTEVPTPKRRSKKSRLSGLRGFARQGVAAIVLVAGLLLAAAFVAVAVPGNAVARDAEALRAEIAQLQVSLADKQAAAAQRRTDQYVLDQAHELGFVRPGEALVSVRTDEGAQGGPVAPQAPTRFQRWLALFIR